MNFIDKENMLLSKLFEGFKKGDIVRIHIRRNLR